MNNNEQTVFASTVKTDITDIRIDSKKKLEFLRQMGARADGMSRQKNTPSLTYVLVVIRTTMLLLLKYIPGFRWTTKKRGKVIFLTLANNIRIRKGAMLLDIVVNEYISTNEIICLKGDCDNAFRFNPPKSY